MILIYILSPVLLKNDQGQETRNVAATHMKFALKIEGLKLGYTYVEWDK